MPMCYSTRQQSVFLTHACAVVPKEGGGDAGCDIMIMFSPGSPISLDPKEERKEGSPIGLDPKEERKEESPISL
jgi:hypothetical protein